MENFLREKDDQWFINDLGVVKTNAFALSCAQDNELSLLRNKYVELSNKYTMLTYEYNTSIKDQTETLKKCIQYQNDIIQLQDKYSKLQDEYIKLAHYVVNDGSDNKNMDKIKI